MKGLLKDPRAVAFLAALIVRALYLVTAHGPAFEHPLIDADYYDAIAVDLSEGRGFPPGPFWQPPLYPVLLAGLYSVFGHTWWAPRLLQMVLGALVALLVADIAKRFSDKPGVALLAGMMVALHGPLVFYDGELLATSVAVFLGTLAVWLALIASKSSKALVASGLAIGLGALAVVPTLLLLVPVVYAAGRPWRRAGWVILPCALIVLPVTLFNYSRCGEWILISANGGVNLYLGNGPNVDEAMAIRPGAGWEDLMREPERQGITTPGGQDSYFAQRAIRFCGRRPDICLKNFAWKARLLLLSRELPRNESLEVVRYQSPVLAALTPRWGPLSLPYGLLWPLGLVGMLILLGTPREKARFPLVLAALMLCIPPVLFFVTGRYRAPIAPFLCILAALGAEALLRTPRGRKRAVLVAVAVIGVLFAVWPAQLAVDRIDFASEVDFATGGRLARLGNDSEAVIAWQRAITRRPNYFEAHYNLGLAFERLGRYPEAVETYERLLRRWPNMVEAQLHLGDALLAEGRVDAAEQSFRNMLAAGRHNASAMLGLARVLLRKNERTEAITLVEQAEILVGPHNEEVSAVRRALLHSERGVKP